jgi:hypothetical protein
MALSYVQRLWDDGTAGWVYYTKSAVDPTPTAPETDPNYTGAISSHSIVAIFGFPTSVAAKKLSWTGETNSAVEYLAGFYEFSGTDNDFSPVVNFGTANVGKAAHFMIVTGAATVDEVTIRVTGVSQTDAGVRTPGDSEDIVIPNGTPIDTYFETSKKWHEQVSVETIAGTAVTCNYGWCKYHDVQNTDFTISGLEAIYASDSTDSTSDIELLHHKATGWTFNVGADPTTPAAVASRSGDHGASIDHEVGAGAWKRANLSLPIAGSLSEGFLFRLTSGSTGVGNLSFRNVTIEVTLEQD